MKNFQANRSEAFSLIEVMVGTVVAGMVMVAVYMGMASGFQTARLAREDLRATQILVERLEAIRGCKWAVLTNSPPPSFQVTQYTSASGGGEGVTYSGSVTLESATNVITFNSIPAYVDDETIKAVTITLTWTSQLSTGTELTRKRSMSTFITEHGLQSYVVR